MKELKKKLFITSCYLVVSILLLLYVSYSQYRINIEAIVIMPRVQSMNCAINLSTSSGTAIGLVNEPIAKLYGFLDTLAPGSSASKYCEEDDQNHKIVVTINSTTDTAIGIDYTLSVITDGVLPLEFILKDDSGEYSVKSVTGKSQELIFVDTMQRPILYTLTKDAVCNNKHYIYVGWNTDDPDGQDISLCKEVEKICIKAKVVGQPGEQMKLKEEYYER